MHAPENERLDTQKSWAWEMVIPEKQKAWLFLASRLNFCGVPLPAGTF